MAEEGLERTEDPTPRRREEARKQGQFAYSSDFSGSVLLMAGVVGLIVLGPELGGGMLELFRSEIPQIPSNEFTIPTARDLFFRYFVQSLSFLGSFFALLVVASVAANILQVGFHITPERLEFNFDKLNPASGLQKLFSFASVVKGLLLILKVIALAVVAVIVLQGRIGIITSIGYDRLASSAANSWALTMRLSLILASVLLLIGIIDYIYQIRRFENSLKMTKQELKEELKQDEGDPLIKQRVRQIARERARQKMLASVPKATVVLTNPTEYAVALRYQPGEDPAPVIIARGRGILAKRIAEIARTNYIPVLERPPLTRALYKAGKEGQEIPVVFYQVIAEIIAFVMELKKN